MEQFFIIVDIPFGILLDKQQSLLKSRHSNISIIKWDKEIEIRADDTVQDEAQQQKIEEKGATRGAWAHKMRWFQQTRFVGLKGFGYNYLTNLRENPGYSKLQIVLGQFTNDETKLSASIKSRTHDFVMEWPQYIFQNRCGGGQRYVLNKALDEIAEDIYEENVRVMLETKQYLKMGSRSNPRDENVQVPARRSREEIRQEVDLERRKEEMKKEEKMKAESEAFYLKLSIQA